MSMPAASAVPRFPPGVRLHHDTTRQQWVVLAPERVIELDDIAYAVLALCDGLRDVDGIVAILAREYDADPAQVRGDVLALIDDLAARRVLRI